MESTSSLKTWFSLPGWSLNIELDNEVPEIFDDHSGLVFISCYNFLHNKGKCYYICKSRKNQEQEKLAIIKPVIYDIPPIFPNSFLSLLFSSTWRGEGAIDKKILQSS